MGEEMNGTYMGNESNNTFTNVTDNSTLPTIYQLGPPLATISSTCIIVGTFFSILCIYRYLRKPNLRTYFTYIFHHMLIYCLISSFINVPVFLMGYYLSIFEHSYRLCQYYTVNASSINIGMITCLAYASLERNYLIFRKNGLLSWRRQWIPTACLLLYSYFISILLVFLPQCDYIPCTPCYTGNLQYMFIWLVFSFIIPESIMFISTILLMVRLYRQRINGNRTKEGNIFHRIVIQMALYAFWSCLYYCPPTFYNLALIFDPNRFSPPTRSAMLIVSTVSVQSYPIFTFLLMTNYHRRTKRKQQPANESILRLNALPTITEQQMA